MMVIISAMYFTRHWTRYFTGHDNGQYVEATVYTTVACLAHCGTKYVGTTSSMVGMEKMHKIVATGASCCARFALVLSLSFIGL